MPSVGKLNLPSMVAGTRWRGVGSIKIQSTQEGTLKELAAVRIQFRTKPDYLLAPVAFELNSNNNSIQLVKTDPDDWEIAIPPQDPYISPGRYYHAIKFIDVDGTEEQLIAGMWIVEGTPTE